MRYPIFMVWRKVGGTPPTVTYSDSSAAHREAERLAKLTPGVEFFVMQSIESCIVAEPVKWTKHDDEVPF